MTEDHNSEDSAEETWPSNPSERTIACQRHLFKFGYWKAQTIIRSLEAFGYIEVRDDV